MNRKGTMIRDDVAKLNERAQNGCHLLKYKGFCFSVFFWAVEDRRFWNENGLNSDENAGAIACGNF